VFPVLYNSRGQLCLYSATDWAYRWRLRWTILRAKNMSLERRKKKLASKKGAWLVAAGWRNACAFVARGAMAKRRRGRRKRRSNQNPRGWDAAERASNINNMLVAYGSANISESWRGLISCINNGWHVAKHENIIEMAYGVSGQRKTAWLVYQRIDGEENNVCGKATSSYQQ